MNCIQHRFKPHPELQRWLFCELCGVAKEIGAETRARAAQPRAARRPEPQQRAFDFGAASDRDAADLEAQALRMMREAGVDTSGGMDGMIARNGERVREPATVRVDDEETDLATTTAMYP